MKKLLPLIPLLFPTLAYSQNYSISTINIYPSFATIEFIANIDNKLDINMPASFDLQSFKLNYATSENITSFKVFQKTDNFDTPTHMLADEKVILALQKKITKLGGEIESLQLKSTLFSKMNFEQKDVPKLEKDINSIAALQLANATKSNELQNELNGVKYEYDIMRKDFASRLPEHTTKSIHIEATSNGKGVLRFEATTQSISWRNIYELSLNSKTGAVDVVLLLSLSQQTGIELSGDMILHLTNPAIGNINNKLEPQIVTVVPKDTLRMNPVHMSSSRDMEMMDENNIVANSKMMQKEIIAPTFNRSLSGMQIVFKANVKSDGIKQDIVLDKYSLKSKVEVTITPLINRYAVISAVFDNLTKPFISGIARLYVDNVFSSTVNMQDLMDEEKTKILFGYTKLIKSERENLIGKADDGFLKGNQLEGYKITVTNQTGAAQKVTVVDRVPVSNDSKLKVDNLEITPKGEIDKSDGIVKWVLDFDKNGSKDIEVKYKLVYPKDMILIQ